jgi:hypothetical protein
MRGLVPRSHVFPLEPSFFAAESLRSQDADGRNKPGRDQHVEQFEQSAF